MKGVVELGKAVILPAIGFTAKGVTKRSLASLMGAKAPPPPSPVRLLASSLFLPYGAWQLYKLLASDGDPNPELWQRRAAGDLLDELDFVDCCFAAAFLVMGIAFVQPWVIIPALMEVPQIVKSIRENFL
ncbi:hypothetical protein C8T65DRAFT_743416 [Cerioporus squamosus]|nr:hypothetical protein C8T65DRAFT_743416 [Cerioporus squamosus]